MNAVEGDQEEERLIGWVDGWVDLHQLKQINGLWRKGNHIVVTEGVEGRRWLIEMLHDPPAYGHLGISQTINFIE
jgi:hypothetical protein